MKYTAIDSYVRQLLRSRDLTLQGLCALLGYRSLTSLTRIMQGSANRESLMKFAERLHACTELALTRQESSQLDDLIELRDIGDEDYGAMLALRRMIRGEPFTVTSPPVLHFPDGSAQSFLGHYSAVRIYRMLIVNSEQVALYHDLALLLARSAFPVEHFMYAGNHPLHTVQCLHAAMQVLYCASYESFSYSIGLDYPMAPRGLITSDLLLCDYEAEDGRPRHEMIVFTKPGVGQVQWIGSDIPSLRCLLPPRSEMSPIRLSVPGSDLLQYAAFCEELERDRAIYRIKPDLGLEQIPPALLRRAVDDAAPELHQALDLLEEQFGRRQQNLLTKPNPQYHVLKRQAMWEFVHTGRLSDHPWCCRSFTPAERAEILRFLRHTLMELPGFHLHFLKDDDALRDDEIVLYEGRGLSIIKPGTDYDLQNEHVELMITQPEFIQLYRRFFMESTLRYRVETEEASAREMDRMIAACLQAC